MGTGFHMHVAETRDRPALLKEATGFRSVEYLDHLGVLGPDVVLAHCVWLNDEERESIARSGTSVAHNPVSNQFLADGVAPVPDFLGRGIRVALGTDGAASNNALDMFEVMKSAALIQKVHTLSCEAMSALEVLKAATRDGARALGIGDFVGSLEVGKRADIVLLTLDSPGMVPCYSAASNVVYSATSRAVDTVIIDGQVVAREGKCLTLDREAVFEQARRLQRHVEATAVSS
jgi:5-methylthioadenosine/S-adenosylhomocysteine deaminase